MGVTDVEAKILRLIQDGYKIRLVMIEQRIVGFMLYDIIYNCILLIEGVFILPGEAQKGLGVGIIESLGKPIKKIFGQTHIGNPPKEFLKLMKRSSEILREGDLITWQGDWGV